MKEKGGKKAEKWEKKKFQLEESPQALEALAPLAGKIKLTDPL